MDELSQPAALPTPPAVSGAVTQDQVNQLYKASKEALVSSHPWITEIREISPFERKVATRGHVAASRHPGRKAVVKLKQEENTITAFYFFSDMVVEFWEDRSNPPTFIERARVAAVDVEDQSILLDELFSYLPEGVAIYRAMHWNNTITGGKADGSAGAASGPELSK